MEPLALSPSDEIDILYAHTAGAPRELIKTFRVAYRNSPQTALRLILLKLQKRFGASNDIANELRARLEKFSSMKGSESDPNIALKAQRIERSLCYS